MKTTLFSIDQVNEFRAIITLWKVTILSGRFEVNFWKPGIHKSIEIRVFHYLK